MQPFTQDLKTYVRGCFARTEYGTTANLRRIDDYLKNETMSRTAGDAALPERYAPRFAEMLQIYHKQAYDCLQEIDKMHAGSYATLEFLERRGYVCKWLTGRTAQYAIIERENLLRDGDAIRQLDFMKSCGTVEISKELQKEIKQAINPFVVKNFGLYYNGSINLFADAMIRTACKICNGTNHTLNELKKASEGRTITSGAGAASWITYEEGAY